MISKYKNIIKKSSLVLIVCIISSALFSCKSVKIENSQKASIKDYTKGEVMTIVADEKNKYVERFGPDIWNLKSGDGSRYYSDLVVQNIKKFIENIITINLMSDKYNIVIPPKDMDKILLLADEYYDGLTEQDKSYMTTTREEAKNMYSEFHKARLIIDHVTKNADIELSISEAKVAKVQYIILDDRDTAVSVATRSQARGANFTYFAKQYTKDKDNTIERVVMRGDEFSRPFPEIFYLATGQVSEVLEFDGKYYVFKCLDDYMEEETSKRKRDILKQIKEDAFFEEYNIFKKENEVYSDASYWKEINLREGEDCTVHNFYDLYYKYFPMNND